MTRNLEEEMAKALEGQFFWEQTTKYEDSKVGFSFEIRRAQRKFVTPPKKFRKPVPASVKNMELVAERIAQQARIPGEVREVKDAILEHYGIEEADFEGNIPRKHLFPALAHYVWTVLNLYPHITISDLGRVIGKHHSTVIYHRDLFEKRKDDFLDNIGAVNKIIEQKRPG